MGTGSGAARRNGFTVGTVSTVTRQRNTSTRHPMLLDGTTQTPVPETRGRSVTPQ